MKTYEDMTLEELEENEDEFNEEDEKAIEMYRLEHHIELGFNKNWSMWLFCFGYFVLFVL